MSDPDVNTTSARVERVPLGYLTATHERRAPGLAGAQFSGLIDECETTFHENGRPTLCECGEVLYKVDETMDDPRWDDEETGG